MSRSSKSDNSASDRQMRCFVDDALDRADMMQDDHLVSCLLLVYAAVSIPKLTMSERSEYKASLEGKSCQHVFVFPPVLMAHLLRRINQTFLIAFEALMGRLCTSTTRLG